MAETCQKNHFFKETFFDNLKSVESNQIQTVLQSERGDVLRTAFTNIVS